MGGIVVTCGCGVGVFVVTLVGIVVTCLLGIVVTFGVGIRLPGFGPASHATSNDKSTIRAQIVVTFPLNLSLLRFIVVTCLGGIAVTMLRCHDKTTIEIVQALNLNSDCVPVIEA